MLDGFIKVAAVTPRVRVADVSANLSSTLDAIEAAAQEEAKVIVLPELSLTGSTCGDLFWQDELLRQAEASVKLVASVTQDLNAIVFVGAPLRVNAKLFNCAVACAQGQVLGVVPQVNVHDTRHFTPGPAEASIVPLFGDFVPFGANQLFVCDGVPNLSVAAEVGCDFSAPVPPSVGHALAGATIIAHLSASEALAGRAELNNVLLTAHAERLICAYVRAEAGDGESTTDAVFAGHSLVAERHCLLAEAEPFKDKIAISEVDVDLLAAERRRASSFEVPQDVEYLCSSFELEPEETLLTRPVNPAPFIPANPAARAARCEEILNIQAHALAARLSAINCKCALIGISGGLDSTLALLVTARAFDLLELDRSGICAITMPGFGTTDRTHNNAWQLAESLGATPREIAIGASVRQHFADIGHDESVHNAAYENAQARERTQILMDVANDLGGLVVGTGDMSELALGWATYNGDHMSMYAVNAAVPKTLIRHIVRHVADTCCDEREAKVLIDVVETPVSPELLPANADGTIAQQTEDLVGPYELHDFFIYHVMRWGERPHKVLRLAEHAFGETYDSETILKWLRVFYRRFFSQQFKRSCSPDGPAVGSVGLSPRGAWQMPSDASSALWLAELEELEV